MVLRRARTHVPRCQRTTPRRRLAANQYWASGFCMQDAAKTAGFHSCEFEMHASCALSSANRSQVSAPDVLEAPNSNLSRCSRKTWAKTSRQRSKPGKSKDDHTYDKTPSSVAAQN
eukprot:TRINITY_DN9864_c0_g1_i3.p4 TRINITY_DN9864_c0_g1~~TRINITY_DN9864_c0_g1_i3.p4  ORF type:complete len:116 (+),score=4.34 TRINITY_DN9864_c0_g1_i3:128-475(+)